MAKENIMFFVAGFFGCMGSKNEAFSNFFQIAKFFEQVKGTADGMCLVKMVHIRIKANFVHQFGTAHAKQNKLCHFGSHVSIV